ncbi:MAG: cell division protein ZapE [Ardenticatenales bacterium]|nr:cell division protein ZapE [Ardenticatenales bacterium]
MSLFTKIEQVAHRSEIALDLSIYDPDALSQLLQPIEGYLTHPREVKRGGWFNWLRSSEEVQRVSPLLLTGPVGTGKTTLMLLLDRALPEASCSALFQQEIVGHPSTAENSGAPLLIEVRPLSLMGQTRNLPTGVIRLRELQTFYRLYTYDRRSASVDPAAAEHFVQLFHHRLVFIDEFVPDVVTSFPMKVINHLADHGILVVLSSNRRETPFVEGVQVISIVGEDRRQGNLALIIHRAGPHPMFDTVAGLPPTPLPHVARGLQARVQERQGRPWMYFRFDDIAYVPADWLTFQHLLQFTHGLLLDEVPLFDVARGAGVDAARRFVLLIDAIYDERRPIHLRLTNAEPLPNEFDIDQLEPLYPSEILLDLERALSRLRQLSTILPD